MASVSAQDVSGWLTGLWRWDVFPLQGQPITFGQLVVAVLILVVGVWAVLRGGRLLVRYLTTSKRLDSTAVNAIHKICAIVGVAAVLMTSMATAGIPMTAFTVITGALAIGFGFGAQNLMGNLISGLWIMVERPICIGDLIEVGIHRGKVMSVGIRCTTLRRIDGVEVLIPNTYFIQNEVVNWTHQDHYIRGEVKVGIAYGSDIQLARDLLIKRTRGHAKVIQPERVGVFF